MLAHTRLVIFRSLIAVIGGYSLAALFTASLPRLLPQVSTISRADASLYAMMLSFLVFALWILYSYSAKSSRSACIGWAICSGPLMLGFLFEIPTP
ncbi:hypothetical protein KJI95_12160 [Shewanella sp. JM162201]|uniref:DUF3649 domain-containing protein n=1 Tax=Shewanella jiangmenensis TaxID=2837387 RepID=A0ABS5V6K1_9GAMM|nr:hypothetical protein [Shewanella jiangmenensis]MBT1445276.1 hypothetical protein [Shewanella jiangmenensis]